MLNHLIKLITLLNSQHSPRQIAAGVSFAGVVGLSPVLCAHSLVFIVIALMFRVNLSAFVLFTLLFSGIAYLIDPWMQQLGYLVLNAPVLYNTWSGLYNSSLGQISQFNNTLVMGSFLMGVILFLPLYHLSVYLINRYRNVVMAWLKRSPLMAMLKASRYYRFFQGLGQ